MKGIEGREYFEIIDEAGAVQMTHYSSRGALNDAIRIGRQFDRYFHLRFRVKRLAVVSHGIEDTEGRDLSRWCQRAWNWIDARVRGYWRRGDRRGRD